MYDKKVLKRDVSGKYYHKLEIFLVLLTAAFVRVSHGSLFRFELFFLLSSLLLLATTLLLLLSSLLLLAKTLLPPLSTWPPFSASFTKTFNLHNVYSLCKQYDNEKWNIGKDFWRDTIVRLVWKRWWRWPEKCGKQIEIIFSTWASMSRSTSSAVAWKLGLFSATISSALLRSSGDNRARAVPSFLLSSVDIFLSKCSISSIVSIKYIRDE